MTCPRSHVPPVADQRPHAYTHHGVTVEDPWHWLRDNGSQPWKTADVLAYLGGCGQPLTLAGHHTTSNPDTRYVGYKCDVL